MANSQFGVGIGANGQRVTNTGPTTTNGPGGQFTTGTNGQTTNQWGQAIVNPAGYQQAMGRLENGSDFSSYQTGVTNSLASQNQANQQYQDLLKDPSKVQQTAGYQFALDQGNQAINRSAAAKGMSNSGGILAELAKYGQGMASQQYQQQLNNYQQNFENQGKQLNSLTGLMQGAQKFGTAAGYYDPKNYYNPGGTNPSGPVGGNTGQHSSGNTLIW